MIHFDTDKYLFNLRVLPQSKQHDYQSYMFRDILKWLLLLIEYENKWFSKNNRLPDMEKHIDQYIGCPFRNYGWVFESGVSHANIRKFVSSKPNQIHEKGFLFDFSIFREQTTYILSEVYINDDQRIFECKNNIKKLLKYINPQINNWMTMLPFDKKYFATLKILRHEHHPNYLKQLLPEIKNCICQLLKQTNKQHSTHSRLPELKTHLNEQLVRLFSTANWEVVVDIVWDMKITTRVYEIDSLKIIFKFDIWEIKKNGVYKYRWKKSGTIVPYKLLNIN